MIRRSARPPRRRVARRRARPTRTGRLAIGSAGALISLHDFLRTREIRRTTPALPIEVLPLPAAGKPAAFSPNNVGSRLVPSPTAQPTTIRAGEPVQVTLTLSGEGSLAGFRLQSRSGLLDAARW